MPYSSADDSNLPSNVKKLPGDKRRQWIAVFNSVLKKSGDDGAAMRQANGAVKAIGETTPAYGLRVVSRSKAGRVLSGRNASEIKDAMKRLRDVLTKAGIDEGDVEAQVKAFGEKCGYESDSYPDMATPDYAPAPYGGATSFDEIQAYEAAHETAEDLSELTWKFQAIFQNIMADDEMTPAERAAAITQASADFATAAQDPEAADTDEGEKSLGIMRHIRSLFGDKDWSKWNEEHSGPGKRTGAPHDHKNLKTGKTESHSHAHMGQHTHSESGTMKPPFQFGDKPSEAGGYGTGGKYSRKEAEAALDDDDERGAFAAFKDTTGAWRWFATWSNNFYDRDGEVFPASAHKDYIDYVDRTGDYPELWLWHVPGSKSGKADFIDYDDGMCIASGLFDEGQEHVAEALSRTKDLAVSHGYTYDPADRANTARAFLAYRTFEISPLPGDKASNIGTSFAALKEAPMLTEQKRKWIAEIVGPEKVAQIEENNLRLRKELESRGISYKEFVDALAEGAETPNPPTPPPSEPNPPAPNPPAPPAPPTEGEGQGDGEGSKAAGTIFAPGFKSEDGGKTWVAHEAKAEGDKAAPPADDFRTGLKEAVTSAIADAIAPITVALKEHDAKLDALKASDDEKIAGAWSKARWDASGVKAASDSPDNIVDPADARTKALIETATKAGGDTGNDDPARPYVEDLQRLMVGGTLPQG